MMKEVFLPEDEKMLLHRMASSDTEAFTQIFDGFWKKVYSIALTYIKSVQAAEDVTQDVFLKLWKNRESLSEIESLTNFLFIMTRNQVLTALRKQSYQAVTPLFSEAGGAAKDPLPDRNIVFKDLQRQVYDAIRLLPPRQQEAIKLSREQGLSHEEIALIMGVSKNTVKNHIISGLNTLRLHLKDHAGSFSLLAFCIFSSFFEK